MEKIVIPDIGGAVDVDVIEILVKPGDKIAVDQSLVTLEGDKATMEIPSPLAGVVENIQMKVGDKVSAGDLVLTLKTEGAANAEAAPAQAPEKSAEPKSAGTAASVKTAEAPAAAKPAAPTGTQEVRVPDVGDVTSVDVVEVLIKPGDQIKAGDSIVTLESEKATMEVPAPFSGEVASVKIKAGDKVAAGDLILVMKSNGVVPATLTAPTVSAPTETSTQTTRSFDDDEEGGVDNDTHAGPAVRRIAYEFGVDLLKISGTGQKGRVVKEDVQRYVKKQLQIAENGGGGGLNIAPAPKVDFAKFGEVTTQPLSKIKKLAGSFLHRNWVSIPHVTQFGEADITELEAFREQQKELAKQHGAKLTPLTFLLKAAVAALKEFPLFNSSLDASGENIILKNYFNIGIAVDTPNGLVVPVIRDVDKKGLFDLAKELGEVSEKARTTGLGMADMQGGCFSVSSLGGLGGTAFAPLATAFTPIINAPEVAILGVSRGYFKPVYQPDGSFRARLIMPLSLSYDHRVIDGADGARFMVYFASCLADIRTLLL